MTLSPTSPAPYRRPFRRASGPSLAFLGSLTFKRNELVPPLRVRTKSGTGNWFLIGKEFLSILVTLGALRRGDRVLEVGCGFGRMAIAIGDYLSPEGSYEGFDVDPIAVQWCRTRLTPQYPQLHFQLTDVRNEVYNPRGALAASEFIFPYSAGTFDVVGATSVFTHLRPPEVSRYLAEISRVMKVGGRCAITYFLLDEESIDLMEAGRSEFRFPNGFGIYRAMDPRVVERAVAYTVEFIRDQYAQTGLKVIEPIHWGSWSGRRNFLSLQDVIIAEKSLSTRP